MRVSPSNQYQLVEQESDEPDLQLASAKNQLFRRCAALDCFGRNSAGPDGPSPLKVEPAQQHDALPRPLVSEIPMDNAADFEAGSNARYFALKSSLKRPPDGAAVGFHNSNELEPSGGNHTDISNCLEKRKVQWTDMCGRELVEIKEYEPSETEESDDEFDNGNERSCLCAIM